MNAIIKTAGLAIIDNCQSHNNFQLDQLTTKYTLSHIVWFGYKFFLVIART